MTKMTDNFTRGEFACECGCGFDDVSLELVNVLQDVRDYFGQPVRVTSACRCAEHNKDVGGSVRSQHLLGTAADIVVSKTSHRLVQDYLEGKHPDTYGIGRYKTFTHIDTRKNKARW